MHVVYQYKLLPTAAQVKEMSAWLDMLRAQYNWLLGERFDWWQFNRCPVNACPLTCSIASVKERPSFYGQKRSLPALKRERPWYKRVHSQVLQEMVKRVEVTFDRFLGGDSRGKRSGRPRFKSPSRYRTFTFPQMKPGSVQGNRVTFPKLGAVKFICHRPLPDGFVLKRAEVTRKADGWYVGLTLKDTRVPEPLAVEAVPTEANSIGIDVGLEYFVACSDGTTVTPPQFFRRAQAKLSRLQAKRELRAKGSTARRKLTSRIARVHQTIARQRRQWQFELAGQLVEKAEVVFVENLKVSNMSRRCRPKVADDGSYLPNGQAAKSGLNKSFADAGIAGFLDTILPYKAEKAGRRVVQVNPAGTSQHCAKCLHRVPKKLSERWHECPECGYSVARDINSAVLIQQVGLGVVLTQKRESGSKTRRRSPRRIAPQSA